MHPLPDGPSFQHPMKIIAFGWVPDSDRLENMLSSAIIAFPQTLPFQRPPNRISAI